MPRTAQDKRGRFLPKTPKEPESPLLVDQDVEEIETEPDPPPAPTQQSALSRLARLGNALARAAGDEARTRAATEGIVDEILKLDKQSAQALMARPEIRELFELAAEESQPPEATGPQPPGTVIYRTDNQGNRYA